MDTDPLSSHGGASAPADTALAEQVIACAPLWGVEQLGTLQTLLLNHLAQRVPVTLDLQGIDTIHSMGLQLIIAAAQGFTQAQVPFRIRHVAEPIRQTYLLLHLDQYLEDHLAV